MNYFDLLPKSILMRVGDIYYTIDDQSHHKIAVLSQSYDPKEDILINCRKLKTNHLNQFIETLDDEIVPIQWYKLESVALLMHKDLLN